MGLALGYAPLLLKLGVCCKSLIKKWSLTRWAYALAYERFDLLEQIAVEMAKAKGVKLPPKLSVTK